MDISLLTIGLIFLALIVVWIILRFVLRFTMRIFTCGCSLIVFTGIVILALKFFT
jgi:hypothetical protein